MTLVLIRPRELRLQIDMVRDALRQNPTVLKVTGRSTRDINMELYDVKNVDIEFANNYFYANDTGAKTPFPVQLLMVPFQWNGEA